MKSRLLIDLSVLEFVGALRKSDRDFLLARFAVIRDFPERYCDYRTQDETGRDIDGHVAGRFAIVFWNDFADRHVKIRGGTLADKNL